MPRKSDPGPIPGAGPPPGDKDANGVSIDENVLPKSIVTRLAKGVLPQNTNIQKDAVLALTKGATVFINYLCATANENAAKSNKKTIMPKDVLEAISQLELEEFRPRLEAELAKFEEINSEKRAASKKAAKDKETAKSAVEGSPGKTSPSHGSPDEEGADEADASPPTKKRKANGKATPVNDTPGLSKPKKGTTGAKVEVDDVNDEVDGGDDKDDYQEEEEEEEEEEDFDEEEADEAQNIGVGDVVEDVDEAEPREDEALDNGYDSD